MQLRFNRGKKVVGLGRLAQEVDSFTAAATDSPGSSLTQQAAVPIDTCTEQTLQAGGTSRWASSFAAVAFPPLPYQLGLRVEHIRAPSAGLLTSIITRELEMPRVNTLIQDCRLQMYALASWLIPTQSAAAGSECVLAVVCQGAHAIWSGLLVPSAPSAAPRCSREDECRGSGSSAGGKKGGAAGPW